MSATLEKMAQSLIEGNVSEVVTLTNAAVGEGLDVGDIMDKGLLEGMDIVGQRFKADEMFIPEVLLCSKAMHGAMEILRPLLADAGVKSAGTIVIGTVEGDLHDIGKNLVAMMFEGAGFSVVNLGIDIPPQGFVDAVKEHNAELVAMSALLTTTMPKMEATIKAFEADGLRDKVKIMVGGAPVSDDFAKKIGADGYSANAASAVELGKELCAVSKELCA